MAEPPADFYPPWPGLLSALGVYYDPRGRARYLELNGATYELAEVPNGDTAAGQTAGGRLLRLRVNRAGLVDARPPAIRMAAVEHVVLATALVIETRVTRRRRPRTTRTDG